jgi:hypothetical protein
MKINEATGTLEAISSATSFDVEILGYSTIRIREEEITSLWKKDCTTENPKKSIFRFWLPQSTLFCSLTIVYVT